MIPEQILLSFILKLLFEEVKIFSSILFKVCSDLILPELGKLVGKDVRSNDIVTFHVIHEFFVLFIRR